MRTARGRRNGASARTTAALDARSEFEIFRRFKRSRAAGRPCSSPTAFRACAWPPASSCSRTERWRRPGRASNGSRREAAMPSCSSCRPRFSVASAIRPPDACCEDPRRCAKCDAEGKSRSRDRCIRDCVQAARAVNLPAGRERRNGWETETSGAASRRSPRSQSSRKLPR
jgi:hypothetical protein